MMTKTLRTMMSLMLVWGLTSPSAISGAQEADAPLLPAAGAMVPLSPAYKPAYLKGIIIHPEDALKFDFLIDTGDSHLTIEDKRQEYRKLAGYFFAALTVADKDQWVNLSPYEKDRIIEPDFGGTVMGQDLLAQDYLLKQITSSLIYPKSALGKMFWGKVYARALKEYGTTDVPLNTFNKVWIVPDKALIYESGATAYVAESHLKVMMEEDYLALTKHQRQPGDMKASQGNHLSQSMIKQIILPALEKEVNEGKNFAQLRQVFSGMILATWYKKALSHSLLGKIYADKGKTQGIIGQDPQLTPGAIYQQYLKAFKKGVFNFVEDGTAVAIPRKYFAGGFTANVLPDIQRAEKVSPAMLAAAESRDVLDLAQISAEPQGDKTIQEKIQDLRVQRRKVATFLRAYSVAMNLAGKAGNNSKLVILMQEVVRTKAVINKIDRELSELEKQADAAMTVNAYDYIKEFLVNHPKPKRVHVSIRNHDLILISAEKISDSWINDLKIFLHEKFASTEYAVILVFQLNEQRTQLELKLVKVSLDLKTEDMKLSHISKDPKEQLRHLSAEKIMDEIRNRRERLNQLKDDYERTEQEAHTLSDQTQREQARIKAENLKNSFERLNLILSEYWKEFSSHLKSGDIQADPAMISRLSKAAVLAGGLAAASSSSAHAGVFTDPQIKKPELEKALNVLLKDDIDILKMPLDAQGDQELIAVSEAVQELFNDQKVYLFNPSNDFKTMFQQDGKSNAYIESLFNKGITPFEIYRAGNSFYYNYGRLARDVAPGIIVSLAYEAAVQFLSRSGMDEAVFKIAAIPLEVKYMRALIYYHPDAFQMKDREKILEILQRDEDYFNSISKSTNAAYHSKPAEIRRGGIDMNSANLQMQMIRRDSRGIPLPFARQDLAALSRIAGFVPRILEIRPYSVSSRNAP